MTLETALNKSVKLKRTTTTHKDSRLASAYENGIFYLYVKAEDATCEHLFNRVLYMPEILFGILLCIDRDMETIMARFKPLSEKLQSSVAALSNWEAGAKAITSIVLAEELRDAPKKEVKSKLKPSLN